MFIKIQRIRIVPCTDIHNITGHTVIFRKIIDHISPISLSSIFLCSDQILQFTSFVFHMFHNTDCQHFTGIFQHKHITFIQIPPDHILLRICNQEHFKIIIFIFRNLSSLLNILCNSCLFYRFPIISVRESVRCSSLLQVNSANILFQKCSVY